MPRLTSNSMSMSFGMLYLSCVKMRELHWTAKTWRVTQCQRVGAFIMMVFGMTQPRGELMTYRARGGHATDWANPTRYVNEETNKTLYNPINGTIVQGGSGSYRWLVYITTLLLQEASGLLDCIVGHPNCTSASSILLVLLEPH